MSSGVRSSPVPDLHSWITHQIDKVEAVALAATPGPWTAKPFVYGKPEDGYGSPGNFEIHAGRTEVVAHQPYEGGGIHHGPDAQHIALHDPAAVLRRCTADRKILARHQLDPDAIWYEAAMCKGCGTYGDMETPVTENLNDCPELLDLAHAHGLTPEIRATLDRPQEGERPEPRAFRIGPPARPTSSVPPALRGPNWKATP